MENKDEITYSKAGIRGGAYYIEVPKSMSYKEGDKVTVHKASGGTDRNQVLGKLMKVDDYGKYYSQVREIF